MTHLTEPFHTDNVEVFNSLINMYAPKRQEFELNVMNGRVQLAVIDFNQNTNREQAVITKKKTCGGDLGEKNGNFNAPHDPKSGS